jgi:hypothetical protein
MLQLSYHLTACMLQLSYHLTACMLQLSYHLTACMLQLSYHVTASVPPLSPLFPPVLAPAPTPVAACCECSTLCVLPFADVLRQQRHRRVHVDHAHRMID